MKYIPSINIEHSSFCKENYIVTPNVLSVVGKIVDSYNSGIHSFNIIGSYGTGKSNFILALEDSLIANSNILIQNNGQFDGFNKFKFIKIVGDYAPLHHLLQEAIFPRTHSDNLFDNLSSLLEKSKKKNEFVFIVIDEFGKLLEYAANNNPERELYLLQKVAEFINKEGSNAILITTLHQNFNTYARSLSDEQRNEWIKVKGRFKEIVFNEPVEQLLYLAAKRIERTTRKQLNRTFEKLFKLSQKTKFASSSITYDTALALYPLDMFAAQALTLSIQRYGQNERTLFSFLEATGQGSLTDFQESPYTTYNLADVYDYDVYNFYSYLSEINSDSAFWTSIRVSLERVESLFEGMDAVNASKLIKTIGMLNLFGSAGTQCSKDDLIFYAKHALGIESPENLINLLSQFKIIRFAEYKSQYVLFQGTDVNIEGEILNAAGIVPRSKDVIEKLQNSFNFPIEFANSVYYRKGTPRYFQYYISEDPIQKQPSDEIDGFINLIFNEKATIESIEEFTKNTTEAILYVYFKNTDRIVDHLWELDKLEYVLSTIDSNDTVAIKEIKALILYQKNLLNSSVISALYGFNDDVVWIYKGKQISINSKRDFNKQLSLICDEVYYATPTYINEMINKHKPSGAISTARINYLTHLLEHSEEKDLGFTEDKFPPEKTIYLTLLKKTGIHRRFLGSYELLDPQEESFNSLWTTCEGFLENSKEKGRKLSELIKILKTKPFKLKQGFIDLWLPTYLYLKRNDYSLYDDRGTYVPQINREVLDILQKSPNGFSVKAFNVEGVKLDLFNKYREAISLDRDDEFSADSLIETIKPFLIFYKKLNKYAKRTNRLKKTTVQFRNVLATAKDPEKTFFEDLPRALGFKDTDIVGQEEVLKRYVELLQMAIRDLRSCYAGLINRLETALVDALGLSSSDYKVYKTELEQHYANIKTYLLTERQRTFLTRIQTKVTDRTLWFQSLAYVILDKQLECILDEEEEYLVNNLLYSFKDLEKYIDVSKTQFTEDQNFFRLELISNKGTMSPKIVHLTKTKEEKARSVEEKINALLSGDKEIDAYALLSIIKKKLGDD